MKVYLLIPKNIDDLFELPEYYGSKKVRAYYSESRAKTYAKKLDCVVVAVDAENGEVVD